MNEKHFHIAAQELLEKQQLLTEQLFNLLAQEYKTLNTSHVESLDDITREKQPLVVSLDTLNRQWLTLLATKCLDSSSEGIGLFLEKYDQTHACSLFGAWTSLQKSAKKCQKSNTVNGTVIALRHQSAQQTLAILRGQMPGDTVYDTHGNNSSGYTGGSALAKA